MAVTLPPVDFFTEDDVFHYTTENRPLQDLATRDEVLAAAVDDIQEQIDSDSIETLIWMGI